MKILEIYKKSNVFYKQQKEKEWKKQRDLLELTDKVVTIVGFGSIGQEVAKRIKPFGTKVYTVGRRHIKSDLIDQSYLMEDLEVVLSQSDIVVLSIALTKETKDLMNEKMFGAMKQNSILINVSRGQIVEERALIKAIENGQVLGAALDVFEEEPLSRESELWDINKLIITPHNSFVSEKNIDRLFRKIYINLSKKWY